MLFEKFISESDNMASELRFYRIVISGLIVLVIFQSSLIYRTMGLEKTILVPPEVNKSFWVTGTDVSKDYLDQMAYWYAGIVLNATPKTAEYQKTQFLRHARPDQLGRLTAEANKRLEYIIKNGASTMFTVESMTVDTRTKRVSIYGSLSTYLEEKRIEQRPAYFAIGFDYINSMLYVTDFKETNDKDIFGVSPTPVK